MVLQDPLLLPQWLATYPRRTVERYGFSISGLRATEVEAVGKRCIKATLFTKEQRRPGAKWEIIIDPSQGYLPIRATKALGDTIFQEIELTYAAHAKVGWVIERWSSKSYRDSELYETTAGVVPAPAVNEPMGPPLFRLEFPTGTHVVHYTKKADRVFYIQESNGRRKGIKATEYGRLSDKDAA